MDKHKFFSSHDKQILARVKILSRSQNIFNRNKSTSLGTLT